MKAQITTKYILTNEDDIVLKSHKIHVLELETTGPDIAVQGGMFGIEHVVDGKKVWLYLPIKSLIKIEIHE